MQIHIVDGGAVAALGAALSATPFTAETQTAMWAELSDRSRFPTGIDRLFNCADVTTVGADDQITGRRENDLVAHLRLGVAGELLTAALRALAQLPAVENMTHSDLS
jgi:hypothetical protein